MVHSTKKTRKSNTDRLSHGKKIASLKKSIKSSRAAECAFDPVARAEFLTGFHKRKMERRNRAAVKNKEEARGAQLAMRADLRAQRARELSQRMEAYRADLGLAGEDGEGGGGDGEEWFGFDGHEEDGEREGTDLENKGAEKGRKKGGLWQVNEYEDDEKTVSVHVEEM